MLIETAGTSSITGTVLNATGMVGAISTGSIQRDEIIFNSTFSLQGVIHHYQILELMRASMTTRSSQDVNDVVFLARLP